MRAITNSTGTITITGAVSYDAWGNTSATSGSITTPFGFTGAYFDSASGLYYMRARWYDATTGQWMSVDPNLTQTREPYAYVSNIPVNGVDPSGMCSWFNVICQAAQVVNNAACSLSAPGSPVADVAECPSATSIYDQGMQNAKNNYERDYNANNKVLEDGKITSEEWLNNQLTIMREYRQAEQYWKRVLEDDEPGGIGDGGDVPPEVGG